MPGTSGVSVLGSLPLSEPDGRSTPKPRRLLAGRERDDVESRWMELVPTDQELAAGVS
jgi:hypothetical protein